MPFASSPFAALEPYDTYVDTKQDSKEREAGSPVLTGRERDAQARGKSLTATALSLNSESINADAVDAIKTTYSGDSVGNHGNKGNNGNSNSNSDRSKVGIKLTDAEIRDLQK